MTDYYTRRFSYTDFHLTSEAKVSCSLVIKIQSFEKDLFLDTEPSNEGEGEYSTDLYSNKAVEKIRSHDASKPLFLYLAFQASSPWLFVL